MCACIHTWIETLVPQSAASASSGSPLEQSTQTEETIEYKTRSDGQSIQTEAMSMYNVASREQSTQTTVSENHSVGVSSFLEQSTETEEVTMSAAARYSTERSTAQTQSLRDR